MAAKRIIDNHIELVNIGVNTHTQIDTHINEAENYIKRDGSLALTANWDIGDGRKIIKGTISYIENESNISYTKNESNISYTKNKSNILYTKNKSDILYIKNKSNILCTKNKSDISYIKNKSNISYQ